MVEIQHFLCGGRKTDNLIESTSFYLKISQFHVLHLNFSQVRVFCNDNRSKLVQESTQPGGFRVEQLLVT